MTHHLGNAGSLQLTEQLSGSRKIELQPLPWESIVSRGDQWHSLPQIPEEKLRLEINYFLIRYSSFVGINTTAGSSLCLLRFFQTYLELFCQVYGGKVFIDLWTFHFQMTGTRPWLAYCRSRPCSHVPCGVTPSDVTSSTQTKPSLKWSFSWRWDSLKLLGPEGWLSSYEL